LDELIGSSEGRFICPSSYDFTHFLFKKLLTFKRLEGLLSV